jgi:hypothetical protein
LDGVLLRLESTVIDVTRAKIEVFAALAAAIANDRRTLEELCEWKPPAA